jgi:WD40 repeat protein
VDTEKQARQLLGHTGHVYSAAWSPDGNKVVSGGLPGDQLHVWDVSTLGSPAFERELQQHPAFAWYPDGKQLVVAEGADILVQNEFGDTRLIQSPDPESVKIYGIDLDAKGNSIACISRKGHIWTVDESSGEIEKVYDPGKEENLFPEVTSKAVAWSPDGKFLAGVGAGGRLRVWNTATGEDVVADVTKYAKPLTLCWGQQTETSTPLLACAGVDDIAFVFNPVKRKIVTKIQQPGWKTGLDWSPNGDKLAIANRRSISIWDVSSPKSPILAGQCEGPSAMVLDLSWSKTQDRIGALVEDGKICIWNAKTFAYCAHFGLHERAPYAIQWSPDGKRLASTARHGRIVFQSDQD